jgi:hypothetical protein
MAQALGCGSGKARHSSQRERAVCRDRALRPSILLMEEHLGSRRAAALLPLAVSAPHQSTVQRMPDRTTARPSEPAGGLGVVFTVERVAAQEWRRLQKRKLLSARGIASLL